jgi:ABC-2 type transport system ATP-binding protein
MGVDSRSLGPESLAKIGYVSENQVLPARLRVEDFFDYLRPCYAQWDRALEQDLRAQLTLPPRRRIGELSHGMRLKMGLACALPFRPKLLVLDEPLSGLDALARDEIIGGFQRAFGEMTVLISSHELDEVGRFATHVAFLHEGQLLFQGSVTELAAHARPLFAAAGGATDGRPLRDIFVSMVRAARHNDGNRPDDQP